VVTHATSYDKLVRSAILSPLGITIDFWEETTYHCPRQQMGVIHKASLLMRFVGGQVGNFNKSIMLASIEASTLDPSPPRGTLIKLQALTNHFIHQVWHTLLSPWLIPRSPTCLLDDILDLGHHSCIVCHDD
jgi:hypothetical protein